MVTSGRIEIVGQGQRGGCCDTSPISISRSKPVILEGYMNDFAWKSYCDKMDEALEPMSKAKKTAAIGVGVSIGIGLTVFIVGFILFAMLGTASVQSFGSSGSPMAGWIISLIGMIMMIAGGAGFSCYAGNIQGSTIQAMKKVCDETSAMYPGVSFHIRDEMRIYGGIGFGGGGYNSMYNNNTGYGRYNGNINVTSQNYIEVYVSDTANVAEQGYASSGLQYAAPISVNPSAPPFSPVVATPVESRSKEERLKELDQLKGLLSEEEYQAKRAEILSEI